MFGIVVRKSFEVGNRAQREHDIDPRSAQGYEPRMMEQPLPLSTTRALQELEDQGASLPLHGSFGY